MLASLACRGVTAVMANLPTLNEEVSERANRFRNSALAGTPIDDGAVGDAKSRLRILSLIEEELREIMRGADDVVAVHPYSAWAAAELLAGSTRVWHIHTDFTPGPVFNSAHYAAVFGPRSWPQRPRDILEQTGIPVTVPTVHERRTRSIEIVLAGGSDGFGSIETCLDVLGPWRTKTVVVTGRNPVLRDRIAKRYGDIAGLYGWVDLPRLMADTRTVITKASGLTLAEAFRLGCACICSPPVVRWEAEAGAILSAQGSIVQIPDAGTFSKQLLHRLLSDEDSIDALAERGHAFHGSQESESLIADRILSGDRRWLSHSSRDVGAHPFDGLRLR